jgi:hypothetical protein
MIGNMPDVGFEYFGMLVLGNAGVRQGVLLVMRSPLYGMVDFPGL